MVDKKKKSKSIKISKIPVVMFLAFIMSITGLPLEDYIGSGDTNTNVAQAAPSFNNPDSRNSKSSVSYLRKSDFTGNGYNKSRGIHPGNRDEGYTCWHLGNVNQNIKDQSRTNFFGNRNRSGGRGNEGFLETHGLLDQCNNQAKLLEYEVYAGDAYRGNYEPKIDRSGNLMLFGWSTLGGYGHHTSQNSSTYAVAVEQVNGRNTRSSSGVHIAKGNKRPVNMTNALSYGGLEKCWNGQFNRFRGAYLNSTYNVTMNLMRYPFRATINDRSLRTHGNTYDSYGMGCNMNYNNAGFHVNVDLNDLFDDLTEEKSYKMYVVQRVNDMIVSAEMAIPNETTEFNYGYGDLKLDGNATPGNNQIYVNRTGIPLCEDFRWGTGCVDREGTSFFNQNERVRLIDIQSLDGNASIYTVRRSNGKVYKHLSNYFSYSDNNEGAVLEYTPDLVEVDVNHLDIASCVNEVAGERWADLRTGAVDFNCDRLREKSSGNIAKQGTGNYPMGSSERFYAYDNGELYKNSRSDNYIVRDSSFVVSNGYANVRTGSRNFGVNLFYVNQDDIHTYRVNYRDIETGGLLHGRDRNSSDRIRGYIQFSNVINGRTVNYNNPQTVIGTNGRLYERIDGTHTSTSATVRDNRTVEVEYQRQPILTVRYINRDNNRVLRQTRQQLRYGQDVSGEHPNRVTSGNWDYYRFAVDGSYEINNITQDTVIDVPYVNKAPERYPVDRYEILDDATEPSVSVDGMSWRLNENNLSTEMYLGFGGQHADAEQAEIVEYVGTENFNSESNEYLNDNGMRQVTNADVMNEDSISTTYEFNKDTVDKYQANISYDFTNIVELNYVCDDGVEERCFEWIIDESNPEEPFWGDDEIEGNNVVIDGVTHEIRQTFDGTIELDIENSLGEEFDLEDLPDDMIVGKGIYTGTNMVGTGENFIDNSNENVVEMTEVVSVNPNEIGDLETQSSVIVEEGIEYANAFDEELPEPKEESRYFIGNIDKNLEESLETEEIDEEEYSIVDLRLDDMTFKLDSVFGLSNKYGLQFNANYDDVSDDSIVLEEVLVEELEELDLGADEVQELDYNISRYFLPIDDVQYNSDYVFKDLVELNSLGLNEITVNYDKEFGFENFLYGNVMDDPIYSEQKDSVQNTEYSNSERLTQSEMESIMNEPERTEKINLFRVTDDEIIDSFLD